MLIKVFIVGWIVLLVAIVLNIAAVNFSLDTWHSVFEKGSTKGFVATIANSSIASKLFLFVIYPGLLGATALLAYKLIK